MRETERERDAYIMFSSPQRTRIFTPTAQGFRMEVEPEEFEHTFIVVKQRASDALGIGIIEQPTLDGAVRCIVANVQGGSPAHLTGLRPGFNILSIDGHHVENGTLAQIRNALAAGGLRVVITAKLLHDKWCCLIPFAANNPGYFCDECGIPVQQGAQIYGCVDCNHDICKSCRAKGRPPAYTPTPHAPSAAAAAAGAGPAESPGPVQLHGPPTIVAGPAHRTDALDTPAAGTSVESGGESRQEGRADGGAGNRAAAAARPSRIVHVPIAMMPSGPARKRHPVRREDATPDDDAAAAAAAPAIAAPAPAHDNAAMTTAANALAKGPHHLEESAMQAAAAVPVSPGRSVIPFASGGGSSASGDMLANSHTHGAITSAQTAEGILPPPQPQHFIRLSEASTAEAAAAAPSPPHGIAVPYAEAVAAAVNAASRSGAAAAAPSDDNGAGPAEAGMGVRDGDADGDAALDAFLLEFDDADLELSGDEDEDDDDNAVVATPIALTGGSKTSRWGSSRWGKGKVTDALQKEKARRKKLFDKARKEQRAARATLAVLEEQAAVKQQEAAAEAETYSRFQDDGSLACVSRNLETVPETLGCAYGDSVTRLDLSFNELTSLDGLEKFEVLEELVLDNNCLDHTMQLELLPDLTTLSVNNNLITDLHTFVKALTEHCPSLTFLSMVKNKACPQFTAALESSGEYELYRHYIICALRNLQFLDSRPVTAQERAAARARFKNATRPTIRPIKECIQGLFKPWAKTNNPDATVAGVAGEPAIAEAAGRGLEVQCALPPRSGVSLKAMLGIEKPTAAAHGDDAKSPVAADAALSAEQSRDICLKPEGPSEARAASPTFHATVQKPAASAAAAPKSSGAPQLAAAATTAPSTGPAGGAKKQTPSLLSFFKAPPKSALSKNETSSANEVATPRDGMSLKAMFGLEKKAEKKASSTVAAVPAGQRKPLGQNSSRIDTVI